MIMPPADQTDAPLADHPGAAGAFDFSALQQALNDPAIRQMAEQIANDATFKEVTKTLQQSFRGMMTAQPAGVSPNVTALDPSKYMNQMARMFNDPEFLQVAQNIGKTIIETDPNVAPMMESMKDPLYREKVEGAMSKMKEDPELRPMLVELEKAGPMAMMKYWNNPEMLSKLGKAMDGTFEFHDVGSRDHEEEFPEGPEQDNLHAAASAGDVDAIHRLLAAGANPDDGDEEGRTPLHFACGYGEIECAEALIAAKANVDKVDSNGNTALHYAAGYGQPESVKLLMKSGADSSIPNADNKTAMDVAKLNEQADVIAALC